MDSARTAISEDVSEAEVRPAVVIDNENLQMGLSRVQEKVL